MRMGCSDADITSIKEGFKEALGKTILAVLSFKDFAVCFSWFGSTLHMMSQVPNHIAIRLGARAYARPCCGTSGCTAGLWEHHVSDQHTAACALARRTQRS